MTSSAYHRELSASCPAGWQVVPLSEVAFFQEGPGILAKDFHEEGVPLLRLKGVEGDFVTLDGCNYLDPHKVAKKWSHFKLDRGDLIISTSASFGRVSEVTREAEGAIPYTGLIRFRPSSSTLDRSYLKAFLSSTAFMQQVEAMASGSVIRHFGPMHLKQMALHLPPLQEQRVIGEISDLLADRLRILRETNTTLEAIAQALFKSWFVDFDPVRAKAEGREPEGMDAATAALFPSEFEDRELGPIPKGWRPVSFGDVATQLKGTISPLATPAREFQHYSLPAFDAGQLPLTELGETIKSNKTPVPPGAVLVSKLNPHIPRTWFVGDIGPHAVCSTEFLIWTPKPGFGTSFLYTLAASALFNSAMRQLVTGTSNSHQRVSPAQLAEIQAAVISNDALAAFEGTAAPMLQQVDHNRRRAAKLAEARDTLLPRLISGRLRLSAVAATVHEVSRRGPQHILSNAAPGQEST